MGNLGIALGAGAKAYRETSDELQRQAWMQQQMDWAKEQHDRDDEVRRQLQAASQQGAPASGGQALTPDYLQQQYGLSPEEAQAYAGAAADQAKRGNAQWAGQMVNGLRQDRGALPSQGAAPTYTPDPSAGALPGAPSDAPMMSQAPAALPTQGAAPAKPMYSYAGADGTPMVADQAPKQLPRYELMRRQADVLMSSGDPQHMAVGQQLLANSYVMHRQELWDGVNTIARQVASGKMTPAQAVQQIGALGDTVNDGTTVGLTYDKAGNPMIMGTNAQGKSAAVPLTAQNFDTFMQGVVKHISGDDWWKSVSMDIENRKAAAEELKANAYMLSAGNRGGYTPSYSQAGTLQDGTPVVFDQRQGKYLNGLTGGALSADQIKLFPKVTGDKAANWQYKNDASGAPMRYSGDRAERLDEKTQTWVPMGVGVPPVVSARAQQAGVAPVLVGNQWGYRGKDQVYTSEKEAMQSLSDGKSPGGAPAAIPSAPRVTLSDYELRTAPAAIVKQAYDAAVTPSGAVDMDAQRRIVRARPDLFGR